jgi:hypothetical protein
LVFLGALDRFPTGEAHLFLDAAGDVLCSPSAMHPSHPLHFERATMAKRACSPIRLHVVRAKSANLCSVAAIAPPQMRSLLPAAPGFAAFGACHRPTGARAPPSA